MAMENKKFFDLSEVKNIVGDDADTVKHMLQIFVDSTPETLDELNQAHLLKNHDELARSAHKMKPSLDLLKIDRLHHVVRTIDKKDKVEQMTPDALQAAVDEMNAVLQVVFSQMKQELL
jgi:HPt (histidine-containing phosphotransfer) domain-containing protein